MSLSDIDLDFGIKESQFIKRLDKIFSGVRSIEHYANLCHSAVYGVFEFRLLAKKADQIFYRTLWKPMIRKSHYEVSRDISFMKENPFYCLIYNYKNSIERKGLSIDEIRSTAHELSTHEFHRVMKGNSRIRAALKSFMGRSHPQEEWWLSVHDEKYREIVEALFYGALAVIFWRHISHEVSRLTKENDKRDDHIEAAIFSISDQLNGLIKKLCVASPDADLNEANASYLNSFLEYREYIENRKSVYLFREYDPRKGSFAKDKGFDVFRFMQSDIIFCLRNRIEGKYNRSGLIEAALRGEVVDRSGPPYTVDETVVTRALGSGLDVAKCVTDFVKGDYVKVGDIEAYVVPHMARKISEIAFHDSVDDLGGGVTGKTLITRGEFYEAWENEFSVRIIYPDIRLSRSAYWYLPSVRRLEAMEHSVLGSFAGQTFATSQ